MSTRRFNLDVTEAEAEQAIGALKSFGYYALAKKWQQDLEDTRDYWNAQDVAAASLAEHRAERAREHVLTERQAHCLAARRSGENFRATWSQPGEPLGRWLHGRSMGGASRRMVETLVDEGLLTEKGWHLTPEGSARLTGWEAKHKTLGPRP